MPVGSPCTSLVTPGDATMDLGAYYDPQCAQGGVGCNYMKALCRVCAKKPALVDNPYPKCPSCV